MDTWKVYFCSIICRRVEIVINVIPTRGKQAWFLCIHLPRAVDNRRRIIQTNIWDAVLTKLIPRWFSHEELPSFMLIIASTYSYQSLRTCSVAQMNHGSSVRYDAHTSSPSLNNDRGSPSDPEALSHPYDPISDEILVVIRIRSIAGASRRFNETMGQLNCTLKCSTHHLNQCFWANEWVVRFPSQLACE